IATSGARTWWCRPRHWWRGSLHGGPCNAWDATMEVKWPNGTRSSTAPARSDSSHQSPSHSVATARASGWPPTESFTPVCLPPGERAFAMRCAAARRMKSCSRPSAICGWRVPTDTVKNAPSCGRQRAIIARLKCSTSVAEVRKSAVSRGSAVAGSAGLTHLDEHNRPAMVDVSAEGVTHRIATAEARVRFPLNVAEALRKSGHRTKKGPVFDTAIVSGVMAAKRTHELIPFCHPLGLDNCAIEIEERRSGAELVIRCQASVHHRTGVEMEALTGATVAALTVYDMCKALSHEIEITSIRLLEKSGGKRDFRRKA